MFENIDIEKVKEELKNLSKNYKENFAKIEKFIENEIEEILNLKKNNKSIIPQIFFDDQHIGGYDEVRALEKENKLQDLLNN